jgi:hypothetical protein
LRRLSASWLRRTCGNPFVSCRGAAGELDGSRQRSFDRERIRRSAGEHRARTTIRRREVDARNGKESRVRADRSPGRPAKESEPIGDRGDKLSTRVPSSGGSYRQRQTNRVLVFIPSLFPSSCHPDHERRHWRRRPRRGGGRTHSTGLTSRRSRPGDGRRVRFCRRSAFGGRVNLSVQVLEIVRQPPKIVHALLSLGHPL